MNEKINLEESITLWIKSIENKVALPKIDLLIFLYNIRESKKYKNFIVSKIRKDADLKTLYKNAVKLLEKTNLNPTLNTLLAIRTEEAGYQAFYLK